MERVRVETFEEGVYQMLSSERYSLQVGGKDVVFRYATLDDLQKLSALVSTLPKYEKLASGGGELSQLIDSFSNVDRVVEIVLLTAVVEVECSWWRRARGRRAERRRLEQLVRELNSVELFAVVQQLMKRNHLFFYQNTITFLRGMSHLKPTKETAPTAHTQ